jgi:hypothetical protein
MFACSERALRSLRWVGASLSSSRSSQLHVAMSFCV